MTKGDKEMRNYEALFDSFFFYSVTVTKCENHKK